MLALRWIIGILSAGALVLFALILIVGKGLADAYRAGSGSIDFLRSTLPFALGLLLVGMLASAIAPGARMLLHAVAVGVVLSVVGCLFAVVPNHPGEGMLYVAFFSLWLIYYVLAAWTRP